MEDSERHLLTVPGIMGEDERVDFAFLVAYLVLIALTYWRTRSIAWLAVGMAASVSIAGVLVNLAENFGHLWSRVELQWVLLAALAVLGLLAYLRGNIGDSGLRRQFFAIWLPFILLIVFFWIVTTFWTAGAAFEHPVSYLMGHAVAEDNAKWLDFTSQMAAGSPIDQAVPMGGPLALVTVFVATVMGVVSQLLLGGYNQVAVAANSVVFGQFFLVALAPLALAPMVEARVPSRGGATTRIPAPLIWLGALVLTCANLIATGYGHYTFQYTVLIAALWAATFMSGWARGHGRLLTSLAIAAAMTVWFPLSALAVIVLSGVFVWLVQRIGRTGWTRKNILDLGLWLVVAFALWEPIRSSLSFVVDSAPTASGVLGGVRGVAAAVTSAVTAGLGDSTLFAASGGTDTTGPILGILAVVAALGAGYVLSRETTSRSSIIYVRFAPVILLVFMALSITTLDAWATGGGPHYGSVKFTFMAAVVIAATCLPFALLLLDHKSGSAMTPMRWMGLVGVIVLLMIDTILPRAIAATRPEQWSPANPFNNAQSYWWPADVNGGAQQSIATNPIGCVYMPNGAKVPSALLVSQASDAQRVYSCTRILSGLAGADTTGQPLVDWLRREWLTNTGAWSDVYDGLAAMPDSVLDKPMILLNDTSDVIGLDSMRSLLQRYPKFAGKTPEELAVINGAKAPAGNG